MKLKLKIIDLDGVYYSNDVKAQKDDNSWQETIEDFSQVKSYKIVVENEIVKQGEGISFDYELAIPSNLSFNDISIT